MSNTMREILFRGKRKEHDFFGLGGEWVYGIPIRTHIGTFMCFEENPHYCNQYGYMEIEEISKVIPETIGSFTGLTDKNGNKIFEGDIVKRTDLHISDEPSIGFIEYDTDNTAFLIHWIDIEEYSATFPWKEIIEVIGNIHDNSELLEENNE